MKSKRILYIVPHRMGRSPGQRFRCEHFIPFLRENGYEITYSNLLSAWDDRYFYSFGNLGIKLFIVAKSFVKRLRDVFRCRHYDAVFIYREAHMLGTTFFERLFYWLRVPVIFDFDDSIWLNDTSPGNQKLKWLKRPSKTADICRLASLVIVGNRYLAGYASRYNSNIVIIPTTIDTNYHFPQPFADKDTTPTVIGWTGTSTTIKHFFTVVPVLKTIAQRYGNTVEFVVIADVPPADTDLSIRFLRWSAADEIQQLSTIDIGIMPLPDDEWSRGKCGFKGLQYMAMEIPTIMSPVGVNTEIITHGENGLLAATESEWVEALSLLIENEPLRKKLGKNGRRTVLEKYSIEANKDHYLRCFERVVSKGKIRGQAVCNDDIGP